MKFVLGFFKFLFSFVFSIVALLVVIAFGVVQPATSLLDANNIQDTVQETITNVVVETLTDEDSEIMQQLSGTLEQFGLTTETTSKLLKSEDVKALIDDLAGSIAKKATGAAESVELPSKEDIADVVFNHAEELGLNLTDKQSFINSMGEAYDGAVEAINSALENIDLSDPAALVKQLMGGEE